jgi:hypothetical protein
MAITSTTTTPTTPIRSVHPLISAVLKLVAVNATPVALNSRLHGLAHWERVMITAHFLLSRMRPEEKLAIDRHVLWMFSLLHDSQRFDDGVDLRHGLRAAESVENYLGVVQEGRQRELLKEACSDHTSGELHADPTIATCWDADRLNSVAGSTSEPEPGAALDRRRPGIQRRSSGPRRCRPRPCRAWGRAACACSEGDVTLDRHPGLRPLRIQRGDPARRARRGDPHA